MPDIFDSIKGTDAKGDIFDTFDKPKESFWKSAARTAYQIPSGIAQTKTYPLDVLQMAGTGYALDPEEIEHLRKIHEREGIPFDEEKYREQVAEASAGFPTQGNIERIIEEESGAPLTAQNKLQKIVKLGSGAAKITPGSLLQKGAAGVGAPAISESAQALGVPEPIANILGFGAGTAAASKIPGKISIETVKKPSGLTERRFEKIEKPTHISEKGITKINEKIENEFRDIANNIIEKSPLKETYSSLKNDIEFKNLASETFKDVEKLAEQLPEKFSTQEVGKHIVRQAFKKSEKGFTPSEYTQQHQSFIKDFIKKTPKKEIVAKDLVAQFRQNNKALKEAYEPGKSFAYNRAKREALLDYNKAIESIIKEKFPDSEFSKVFHEANERWSKIMDAEAIDKFMDKMFDGKLKFKEGKQFFDKEGMTLPFKRALGEEGFKDFNQLMKDFMSYEQAHKLLKSAKSQGFNDLAKTGLAYVIHPKLGFLKMGLNISKNSYKKIYESLLDKPQFSIKWDKGIKEFKKGNFKEAQAIFNDLSHQMQDLKS